MMHRGHIHLERKIWNDPLWEPSRPRTKLEAWLDLCLKAKGRPGRELVGYSMIPLERGQLIFSIKGLAREWKWNRDTVRRFLASLEREGRIRVKRGCVGGASKPDTLSDTPYSIITICNYEKYNPLREKPDTQSDTKTTPIRHPRDTSKKVKKEKKDTRKDYRPKYPTVLTILHNIEGWPVDPEKDDRLIQRNQDKHDLTLDQLEQVAIELATWYEDNPGAIEKPRAKPRSRFNTFCRNRAKWDKESGLSGQVSGDGQPYDIMTPGQIMEDATSYCLRAGQGQMDFEEFEAAIRQRYKGRTVNPQAIQGAWDMALREFGEANG